MFRFMGTCATLLVLIVATFLLSNQPSRVTANSNALVTCSWRVVSSPSRTPGAEALSSLAAVSEKDIWAAGSTANDGALFEHWDGRSWSLVDAAPGGSPYDVVTGLAAVTNNDVWAVGYGYAASTRHAVVEHWNGSGWHQVLTPLRNGSPWLRQVSVVSSNDVWAAGYDVSGTMDFRTLVEHWDGSSWSVLATPNYDPYSPTLSLNELYDVLALSNNNVWTVGYYQDTSSRSIIWHWDGSQWQRLPSPMDAYSRTNKLTSIDGRDANNLWALGYYLSNSFHYRPVVIHWDGATWQALPEPNLSADDYQAYKFNVISNNDIWVVGSTTNYPNTFAMHWDGTSWQLATMPPINTRFSSLADVTGLSHDDAWAVGGYDRGSDTVPLIEHYSCAEDTPTPKATNTATATNTQPASATQPPSATASATASLTSQPVVTSSPPATPSVAATATPNPSVASNTPQVYATATSTATTVPTSSPTATPTFVLATSTPCIISFSDVPVGYLFASDIRYLVCAGIVNGYPNGDGTYRFAPNQSTTRGEFAKIVKRGFGLASYTPAVPTFSDVPSSSIFYPFIEAAAHAGVLHGYVDGSYRPNQVVGRGEAAKLIRLASGLPSYTPTRATFADVPSDYFAYVDVETLYQHGILSGAVCGRELCYRPNSSLSRGELSKLIRHAVENR